MKSSAGVFILIACLGAACANEPPAPVEPAESAPPAEPASSVQGQSIVVGTAPVRAGQPSIVVLQPATKREWPPQAEKPVMDQVSLTFIPGVLLVRTGQPTEFRNSDDVLHNVRVNEDATKQGTFNVAIPTGEDYEHTFEREGFYDVGCDIHPGMSATIFASSSPYTAVSDGEGSFEIPDVPPGTYTAVVYAGAEKIERQIEVVAGRTEVSFTP